MCRNVFFFSECFFRGNEMQAGYTHTHTHFLCLPTQGRGVASMRLSHRDMYDASVASGYVGCTCRIGTGRDASVASEYVRKRLTAYLPFLFFCVVIFCSLPWARSLFWALALPRAFRASSCGGGRRRLRCPPRDACLRRPPRDAWLRRPPRGAWLLPPSRRSNGPARCRRCRLCLFFGSSAAVILS